MGAYASKVNASVISGLPTTDIPDYFVTTADQFIEEMLGREFGLALDQIDFFDVPPGGLQTIQLHKFPVISITTLRDNQRGSNPEDLVEDTDFTVDKQAAILKLIKDDFNILKGSTTLTVGTKTVKVTYTYGYETTPNAVKLFADWYLAWLTEVKKSLDNMKSNGAILSRVQVGDYAEAYSTNNRSIDSKYKSVLADMSFVLVRKYQTWDDDGDYRPIL